MKIFLLVFCLMLFFASLATTQEINVEAGADAISAALADAFEGDILILSTDGGVYTESAAVTVVSAVTIKAADGLATMPVWTTSGSNHITLQSDLTLEGIIFEGLSNPDSAESGIVNSAVEPNVLKVNDCEFRNFKGSAVFKEADNQEIIPFDSVTVSNSLFHDCGAGINLGGDHPSGSGQNPDNVSGAYYLWVANCTFYNMEMGIKLEAYIPSGDPVFVYIDHVTIDNCGEYGLYLKEINSESMIWNSIITNCDAGVCIKYSPDNILVDYSDVWNNTNNYYSKSGGGVSPGDGSFSEDPMYTDAASGDYSLSESSPCIGAAGDGQNMGDLRWAKTGVNDAGEVLPTVFSLSQNYPNPFNPATTISYSVDKPGLVKMDIYSITGQKVRSLVNRVEGAGSHSVVWDGLDDMGDVLAGGVYFSRLQTRSGVKTNKMMLVK